MNRQRAENHRNKTILHIVRLFSRSYSITSVLTPVQWHCKRFFANYQQRKNSVVACIHSECGAWACFTYHKGSEWPKQIREGGHITTTVYHRTDKSTLYYTEKSRCVFHDLVWKSSRHVSLFSLRSLQLNCDWRCLYNHRFCPKQFHKRIYSKHWYAIELNTDNE